MPSVKRKLRYGWKLPDAPNDVHGQRHEELQDALEVEDVRSINGARLIDWSDTYHGDYTVLGMWFNGRFYPTREYYLQVTGQLPSGDAPLLESFVRDKLNEVEAL